MTRHLATDGVTMADVHRPEHIENPYPLYRKVREIAPVFWDAEVGAWMVTGYEAALATLRDPRLSARRPQWEPTAHSGPLAAPLKALATQIFVSDPPEHTRLRKQLAKPFLPRPVERLRRQIQRTADDLLDRVADRGHMDFMADYALALPAATVARVIGVPVEDQPKVWKRILSWGVLVDGGPLSKQNPEYHLTGIDKYMGYFREQLARRRADPSDDLLQTLSDGYRDGAFGSEEELLGNLIFVLTAGQTTTAHQIGNTVLSLAAHPDVHARVVADPSIVPAATPEFMRYDSSVQLTKRRALEPVTLGGQRIEAGDEVFVWIGAAHRDPEAFVDPDVLDPDRPKVLTLALGHGIHYCLGGQLGQLVHEIAIESFARRIRNPRVLVDQVERTATPTFRGPHKLPVTFG